MLLKVYHHFLICLIYIFESWYVNGTIYRNRNITGLVKKRDKLFLPNQVQLINESSLQTPQTWSRCGSRSYSPSELREINEKLISLPYVDRQQRVRSLRLYLHIIQSSKGEGKVSDSTISDQMTKLNIACQKPRFIFTLSGVNIAVNNSWFTASIHSVEEREMKRQLHQGTYADLNVYTISSQDNILGWATLPTIVGTNVYFDGVVIDYRTMPGGSLYPYNLGHTLTHEVGHWLGLQHTFEGGCGEDLKDGDGITDTPAQQFPHFGCPSDTTNTCKGKTGGLRGKDPIHNYMGYTDDSCTYEFTPDQGKRTRQLYKLLRE